MVYVAKKWTRERIELVRKYLHKGFTDKEIAEIMTDIEGEKNYRYTPSIINTTISTYQLLEGISLKALVKSGRKVKWSDELISEVIDLANKGFTDYVIADIMTEKHEVKFTQKQISGVRSRRRIQKPNKKSAEEKDKKIDNTDYYKRMAEISLKTIRDNRQQTARIRKFNLEEGKLYTIKTDNTGSNNRRGIKVYRDLKFLYMTDYVLYFKDKHGITKSFIRDNNSVKIKKIVV